MKTLAQIGEFLRKELKSQKMLQADLRESAGLARQTMSNILSGRHDYRVTNLLSVLDRLGYELVLVPKNAAGGLVTDSPEPAVKSRVQAALEKTRVISEGNNER